MRSRPPDPETLHVSADGEVTIPQSLRERVGIDTPGAVFIYAESDRIVVKPVPDLDELHGIHADDREPGAVLNRVNELNAADRRQEAVEEDAIVARHRTPSSESDSEQ